MNKQLRQIADEISQLSAEHPEIAIPVDPEVAEFMGAFREKALSPEDVDEACFEPREG